MNFVKQVREKVVEEYSKVPDPFGMEMYNTHIVSVVESAKILAKKLGADEEIVEISALLHDIGRLGGDEKNIHHITGSEYAEKYLRSIGYPKEKIEKVKHCIFAHRGSQKIPRETVEAECIASGDAMAHFRDPLLMIHIAFVDLGNSLEEGREKVKRKYQRSFEKMIPEAKEMVQDKYDAIMKVLG